MTTTKLILAGVLGGVAMFIWSSLAHMVLPLGHAGLSELSDEPAVLTAMQTSIGTKEGLYFFPGVGLGDNPTKEQESEAMKRYLEKLAKNPSGLLMYHPAGSRPMTMVKWLTVEFLTEVLESLLVVFLLAKTRIASFGGRVGFIFSAGILAAIATNISYWNWYGFPATYTAAYMTTQIVGFLCAGLAVAFVLRNTPPVA